MHLSASCVVDLNSETHDLCHVCVQLFNKLDDRKFKTIFKWMLKQESQLAIG